MTTSVCPAHFRRRPCQLLQKNTHSTSLTLLGRSFCPWKKTLPIWNLSLSETESHPLQTEAPVTTLRAMRVKRRMSRCGMLRRLLCILLRDRRWSGTAGSPHQRPLAPPSHRRPFLPQPCLYICKPSPPPPHSARHPSVPQALRNPSAHRRVPAPFHTRLQVALGAAWEALLAQMDHSPSCLLR